jgi:hypothetical protein
VPVPRRLALLALPGALVVSLAACGDDDDDAASTDTGTPATDVGETTSASEPVETTVAGTAPTDTEPADTEPADTEPADSEPAATEPVGGSTTTGPATAGDGALEGDEAAAAEVWALVFDSDVPFADKAAHIEGAADLEATHTAYVGAAEMVGGRIQLEPTAVDLAGDTATVTYDVLFAGNVAYEDLTGEITLVDGTWVVPRASFCSFMSSARTACP